MKDLDNFDAFFFDEGEMNDWQKYIDTKREGLKKYKTSDPVDRPAHYTQGRFEAIDVIEDAIKDAPNMSASFTHGQVLKYLLRLWLKNNPAQDARKARWYLNRLIDQLDS